MDQDEANSHGLILAELRTQSGHLRRIAAALERIAPPPPDPVRPKTPPDDIDALTVVTPALRKKWADEERANQNLPPELRSSN